MSKVIEALAPQKLGINSIILDPNNPRFSAFRRKVSLARIADEGVQKKTLEEISDFGVDELKDSILQVGFLPVDRIVVVTLDGDGSPYVAIEGNRRLAAIKRILQDIEEGLEVEDVILNTLKELDVLVLEGKTYDDSVGDQLLIQGLRHISGVKNWKPYQQAKALNQLVVSGYSITDAAKAIGMGRSNASWMRKAFCAFEDMRKCEDVELPKDENAATAYFSYFVELLKDVSLRSYFGWSDAENRFTNTAEILKFYRWIGLIKSDEDGPTPQMPMALDVRKLNQVLNHPEARYAFEAGNSIEQAYAFCVQPPIGTDENHSATLVNILNQLNNLPSTFVKRMGESDKETLQKIIAVASEHLDITNGTH